MKIAKEYIGVLLVWFTMLLVVGGCWVTKSYFEAKTYSEITGKHVTTGQALWIQFRIVEPYPTKGE